MLTINIPVYNISVGDLVANLHHQAKKLNVPFEIRVYDDGSDETIKTENRKTGGFPNVVYEELAENLGRAAIRNKMGLDAKFEWLLFIDADSNTVSESYIEKYIQNMQKNKVLCGGTVYSLASPEDPKKKLRWMYGTKREAVSAEKRSNCKGFIITSNNFMIEKILFQRIPFRKNLKNYGHEDTVLGFDLHCAGVDVVHIDNPVEHTGLEDGEVFLEKTRVALQNLHFISTKLLRNNKNFSDKVQFLNRYRKIIRFVPEFFLRLFYFLFHRGIEKHLTGENPRLFWFDIYRLSYFSGIKKPRRA